MAQPLGPGPQLPRPADLRAQCTRSAAARPELQQRHGLRRRLQRDPAAELLRPRPATAQPPRGALGRPVCGDSPGPAESTHRLPDRPEPDGGHDRQLVDPEPAALVCSRPSLALDRPQRNRTGAGGPDPADGLGAALAPPAAAPDRGPARGAPRPMAAFAAGRHGQRHRLAPGLALVQPELADHPEHDQQSAPVGGRLPGRPGGQQPGGLALLPEIAAGNARQQPDGPGAGGRSHRAGGAQTATQPRQGLADLVAELSPGGTADLHPDDQQGLPLRPAPAAAAGHCLGPDRRQRRTPLGTPLAGGAGAGRPAGGALEPIRLGSQAQQLSAPSPEPPGGLAHRGDRGPRPQHQPQPALDPGGAPGQ